MTKELKVVRWAYIGIIYGLTTGKLFNLSWLMILFSIGILILGLFIIYLVDSKELKTKKQPPKCPECKTKMWYSEEGAWICGNCNYMRIPGTGGNQIDKKR